MGNSINKSDKSNKLLTTSSNLNDDHTGIFIIKDNKYYYKKMRYRIMTFTITKSPKKKYSHELINFRVSENLLNKWENSSNKTYQALEEEIDFTTSPSF